jgi:hypothetical protein
VAIVERLMPVSYYQHSLADAHVDQRVLKDLVSIKLPRLHAHLEQHAIDLSMFTFGWFLTVFVDEAPVSTYLRIWDAFLFEGNKVLIDIDLDLHVKAAFVINEYISFESAREVYGRCIFVTLQILFRFALAFLKEAESDLLASTDFLSIHCVLRLIGQRMTNPNHVADVS